jgi:acetylornithine deacetylase
MLTPSPCWVDLDVDGLHARQNGGLSIGMAIVAPQQQRWPGSYRQNPCHNAGAKTIVHSGRTKPSAIWEMSDRLPRMSNSYGIPSRGASAAELLARLVSFDTTSGHSNLELIGFVRTWFDACGVPYRVSTEPSGTKANLHAIIGPPTTGGIALSGHIDTVPANGPVWTSHPFTLREAGGKLYGRGSTDMKGFVACCLAAVPTLTARPLKRPMHLFITYDEETDMSGARRLIADIAESRLKPEWCIVGEPSLMQPIIAHKGSLAMRLTARGLPGHSSQPSRGVNAVHAIAEAIVYIAAQQRRFACDGPFAAGFDPPHTTPHVGKVEGGTVPNTIPERATCIMEWRTIPGDDANAEVERLRAHLGRSVTPAMQAVDARTGFDFEILGAFPGMALDPAHALAAFVAELTGSNTTGKVSYSTEGGLYQEAGIPTIICGPGSIEEAHQPDEFVAQSQLDACDAFISRLADRLAV